EKICEQLPGLAMDKDSGVAKDAIKTINQTQKQLAIKAKEGHKAGEAGDAVKLTSLHGEMAALAKTLSVHVPQADSEHDHDH
ncbi:MAG: hypothetical protein ACYTF1_06350, partial [Planctomycetota bacterium]